MMVTKSAASLRDRRASLSPSSSPLPCANSISSPLAKKPVPKYLKQKAASSETPPRRLSITPTITTKSSGKAPQPKRLAGEISLPSIPALQRPLKPAISSPKLKNTSLINGGKSVQNVSRISRAIDVPILIKKKCAPSVTDPSFHVMNSSNQEAAVFFERQVQEQTQTHATTNQKMVEDSNFFLIEEDCQINDDEPENIGKQFIPQTVRKASKSPVKKSTKLVGVAEDPRQAKIKDDRHDSNARKEREVLTSIAATKKELLSNDVIEETIGKLMGTRKNRVLALVGAFETVFSLQEQDGQPFQKFHQLQQWHPTQHAHNVQQLEVECKVYNHLDKRREEENVVPMPKAEQEDHDETFERAEKKELLVKKEGEEPGEALIHGNT